MYVKEDIRLVDKKCRLSRLCANIVRCLIIKLIFILPLFLLTQEAQKKKLCKKKTLFFGGAAPLDPASFLKKT